MIAARKIQGSPPRVRGTVSYRCFISYVYRITPACAGNRSIKITFRDNAMDHPRVCGEQPLGGVPQGCLQGSPPRVRGTACILRRWCRIDRITPACAGNSFAARSSARASKDHPRVCGEQPRAAAAETVLSGSPPRVRGTGIGGGREHGSHGITPACAGNSPAQPVAEFSLWDHPRVCGEQRFMIRRSSPPRGSPPRVRGTGASGTGISTGTRITPACAGNSPAVWSCAPAL